MRINSLLKWFLLVGLLIGAMIFVITWLNTATVTITTQDQAKIFVKQGDTDFREIGAEKAVFRTRSRDTVFLEARKGEATTQKAVQPKKTKNIEVALTLKDTVTIERISPGPFKSPLVEGSYAYGINPNSRSLSVQAFDGSKNLPLLPVLPFLKQVVWHDSKNFIFIAQGRGAGVVTNGMPQINQGILYTAVARVNGSTLALISRQGLHLADTTLENSRNIAPVVPNSTPFIFADSNYVFYGGLVSEEVKEESGVPNISGAVLYAFDHSGNKKYELNLSINHDIFNVQSLTTTEAVLLTERGLQSLNLTTGKLVDIDFSFGQVNDLALTNNRLLLLGTAGLWEYNRQVNEYYKLASYPSGEEYVPSSLSVSNNVLLFSSNVRKSELKKDTTSANSNLYRIILGN